MMMMMLKMANLLCFRYMCVGVRHCSGWCNASTTAVSCFARCLKKVVHVMCKMGYCSGLQHTYNFYWLTAIYGTYVQYYVVEGFGRHARISYEAGQQPPTRIYFSARIIINATEKILRMIYFQPATRQSTTRAHFPSIAFCTCNI